jgi:hypothetical protein
MYNNKETIVYFFIASGVGLQLLVYADDVNLLGDNVDTIKKNTQTLINAIKEVGLEVFFFCFFFFFASLYWQSELHL